MDLILKTQMIQSILIVKIGAIGDVVMSLPMISFLRKKKTHITWVCGKTVAPLVSAAGVDEIIEVDEAKLFQGNFFSRLFCLCKLWVRLFRCSFDLALTAHSDPRYRLISLFCRKKEHRLFKHSKGKYYLHEYLQLAGATTAYPFPKLNTAPIPFLSSLSPHPTIVIAPGGAKNILSDSPLRRWPIEYYVETLKRLSFYPYNLILIGASSDEWIKPYFSKIKHHDLVGKMSLLDLVELFKKTDLLITHDSGPLHLAKLASCQTLALFGPTNPYEFHDPKENIHFLSEWGKLPCAPCYDGKRYAPCTKNRCLQNIQPTRVVQKAIDLIHFTGTH
jgi:heptosyltransferase-2